MAHHFDTGFAVREPSWHALETLLGEAPTLDDWTTFAGLDWEPVKVPLYLPATPSTFDDEGMPTTYDPALPSGTFAVVRNDRVDHLSNPDPKVRDRAILARGVSDDYVSVEHKRDMTPLVEALARACDERGIGWEFTTAGSLNEGKRTYAVLRLDRPIELPGDPSTTLPYATVLNPHDGTGSVRGGVTATRTVCANTYAMTEAEMEDGRKVAFTIRHVGDVRERLDEARKQIAGWVVALDSYEAMAQHLVSLPVTDDIAVEWVGEFLPIDHTRMTDRQVVNRRREHDLFMSTYHGSPTTEGIRGTAFGLWQTTVEFMDHLRPWRSADAYLARTLLDPVPAKTLARDRIMELVEVG